MTKSSAMPAKRIPVAILGATGAVGQTFIRLLANHPWFEIAELAASERSAGKRYGDASKWLEGDFPAAKILDQRVIACDPGVVRSAIVFSALDSSVAGDVELAFARAGKMVLSNAKNHRMDVDVPLVIPEVNGDHLALLAEQRRKRGWSGGIITNANCSATVAAMALAPLHEAFELKQAFLMTMQAVSGAGYPGVPSLDIIGNVIPYIADEEPKLEKELGKLLGTLRDDEIVPADFVVSSHTNRVPVEHGHTICMTLAFKKKASPEAALDALRSWKGCAATMDLPSRPAHPVIVSDLPDRPQPKRDVNAGGGMSVTVGRVRKDPILDIRLVASGHNTVRGAAGGSVMNAEMLVASGVIEAA
ncbi:MAG: aspartate-semialdehyde dehydrogenase [Gemmatimonadota bacterium]|nr:aspartate-semialdehyde dehydrogenase [Gemmatimonadota bacterium]